MTGSGPFDGRREEFGREQEPERDHAGLAPSHPALECRVSRGVKRREEEVRREERGG
jgi:hypothetical protein